MSASGRTPQTYALVVGINYYARIPQEKQLWGCVNDAQEMYKHIKAHVGENLVAKNVTFLTATNPETYDYYFFPGPDKRSRGRPMLPVKESDDDDKLPTYDNIVKGLHRLYERAHAGDTVFFSYSGHGNRSSTVLEDSGWEGKVPGVSLDEMICPYDIGLNGLGIRDWQLNWLLSRIAKKEDNIKLTVFLDCCNSGGTVRGDDDEGPELDEDVVLPQPAAARVLPTAVVETLNVPRDMEAYQKKPAVSEHLAEMKEAWNELLRGSNVARGGMGILRIPPMGYTCFTGCLAHELSWELAGSYGALTGATVNALALLKQCTQEVATRVSNRNLYRYIFDPVYKLHQVDKIGLDLRYQTPLLLGPRDGLFPGAVPAGASLVPPTTQQKEFAGKLVPVHIHISSSRGGSSKLPPLLFLRSGNAHGVKVGARYGVWLWYENPEAGATPAVVVEVKEVQNVVSVVQPVPGTVIPETWKNLYRREKALGTGGTANPENSLYYWPSGCVASLLSQPIAQASPVRLVGTVDPLDDKTYSPGAPPLLFTRSDEVQCNFQITSISSNVYELRSTTSGTPLIASGSLVKCVESARHIAHYNLIKDIQGDDYKTGFALEKNAGAAESTPDDTYLTFKWLPKDGRRSRLKTPHANVSLYHFSGAPDYSIRRVYPQDGEFESLDENKVKPDDRFMGDERQIGFEGVGGMVKAVVTLTSAGFGAWELGSVTAVKEAGAVDREPLTENKEAESTGVTTERDRDGEENPQFNTWCTLDLVL